MKIVRIHLSLPKHLLDEIDAATQKEFDTRSNFIRTSVIMRLKTDKYVEAQANDKNSDFNAVQTARLLNNSKRNLRKYPTTEFS
jgi:metal-responsive CopG/Arc/MetJ family transcriptional regulator